MSTKMVQNDAKGKRPSAGIETIRKLLLCRYQNERSTNVSDSWSNKHFKATNY